MKIKKKSPYLLEVLRDVTCKLPLLEIVLEQKGFYDLSCQVGLINETLCDFDPDQRSNVHYLV